MATTGVAPQIGAQAGYNRASDCEPHWIREKKVVPAIGRWGRIPYCDDCKRTNEVDDDDEDWTLFPTPPKSGAPKTANQQQAPIAEHRDDPRFGPEGMGGAAPEEVSSRSMRAPLPDQIPAAEGCTRTAGCPKLDGHTGRCPRSGVCTRTPTCTKPFGHTGKCPKNAPKAPKETWQVPGSSTETPKVVKETKLAAAARIGGEIRAGLGGKARHARGEKQKAPAWALQFRELSDEEYAGIVPQRFLQKELEPIVEAILAKQAALKKANKEPKVRIVIDVPHHTNSRHFRDRVSRYMRLRKLNSHTEQVARTNQIIVTAPPEKLPWGKRANGKQAT